MAATVRLKSGRDRPHARRAAMPLLLVGGDDQREIPHARLILVPPGRDAGTRTLPGLNVPKNVPGSPSALWILSPTRTVVPSRRTALPICFFMVLSLLVVEVRCLAPSTLGRMNGSWCLMQLARV